MTVINITGLEQVLGAPGPVAAGVIRAQHWAGIRPYIGVAGAEVTFPKPVVVRIVDGDPEEPVDISPTVDVCCVKWTINADGFRVVRYTTIPDDGPVDFGDLDVVDPATFAPAAVTPTLQATIDASVAAYLSQHPLLPSAGLTP